MSNTSYYRSPFGDTTHTKVFVGGLAWETPTDEMRRYFDQFGEILEAVIITDKATGKSKGYGFVTFRDSDSATRAVADPNPVIDGRKANCNIASFGRPRPSTPRGRGQGGSPSQYQGGGQSSYTGMAAPVQQAAAAQLMYPSYGYTYNSEYGLLLHLMSLLPKGHYLLPLNHTHHNKYQKKVENSIQRMHLKVRLRTSET
ncbi:unnamed protein product [Arabidopsis thaliana]|uniref:(thale cress) hypothetical protein n=1 Tax=Arabidopsis thaliana TaxID=3702 RepID=A0A7G2DUU0_ARATH|nr:unnamed protein product [Arabidopsis thaliana]